MKNIWKKNEIKMENKTQFKNYTIANGWIRSNAHAHAHHSPKWYNIDGPIENDDLSTMNKMNDRCISIFVLLLLKQTR